MNQAEVHKLISALRFKVSPKAYNIKGRRNPPTTVPTNNGNRYRLELLRTQVTNLIVNERLELTQYTGITVREYTERLIKEVLFDLPLRTQSQREIVQMDSFGAPPAGFEWGELY